jgi:hypothetical protein
MACGFCSKTVKLAKTCPMCGSTAHLQPVAPVGVLGSEPNDVAPVGACERCDDWGGRLHVAGRMLCAPCSKVPPLPPAPVQAPVRQPVAAGARGGQYRAAPVSAADFPRPTVSAAAAGVQAAAAATPSRSFSRSVVIAKLREAHAAGDKFTAAGLLVGLAGGPQARARVSALATMDRACAARGWITKAEEAQRAAIVADALADLGFNPLREDGPAAAPVAAPAQPAQDARPVLAAVVADVAAVAAAPVLALPEGVTAEPLRAGDWRGLWMRVQAGQLTEAEARAFGQLWKDAGL